MCIRDRFCVGGLCFWLIGLINEVIPWEMPFWKQCICILYTSTVMVNGQSRFRIHQITMGIGIYFGNREILSATKKEHISPISEEVPTVDFELSVVNSDRAFDVERCV